MITIKEIVEIIEAESVQENSSSNNRILIHQDFESVAEQIVEKLTITVVSQRSELLSVFDGFYEWHKKQGYVSVKRDDFEEYVKTLNCG